MRTRVIAFYLPQYHPFKENDEWWGKGFTEWTNVGKAKPLFKGHYQPRVPADLGYYDLRCPWVREAQAEMAREAGIEGFMYWHYWFGNGKTLMANIFQEVLESGKPDFPFCLGWANHSWTRRTWNSDAQKHKDLDLMLQEYPEEDCEVHFNAVLPAFKDKRYITVDGKPLFMIYAPLDVPNITDYLNKWRKMAVAAGLPGIHFVGLVQGWEKGFHKVIDAGFDAITTGNLWNAQTAVNHGYFWQMLKHKLRQKFPRVTPLDTYPYAKIIQHFFCESDKKENTYPQIIPNWDRSPRSGRRAVIYTGSTPDLFKRHVQNAVNLIKDKQPEHRILFLRSWNEWAEGNYMEPDLKLGHGYLNALNEVIKE